MEGSRECRIDPGRQEKAGHKIVRSECAGVTVAVENIEYPRVPLIRVMRFWIRGVGKRPRTAGIYCSRRMGGVGTARCLPVVPHDQDVRCTVAICKLKQAFPVWTSVDIIHTVTALVRIPRGRVYACRAIKNLRIAFNIWPEQPCGVATITISIVRVGASLSGC